MEDGPGPDSEFPFFCFPAAGFLTALAPESGISLSGYLVNRPLPKTSNFVPFLLNDCHSAIILKFPG